jgi:hypothetical protein
LKQLVSLRKRKLDQELVLFFQNLVRKEINIYFIIDTPNLNTVELTGKIKNLLDFDYEDADKKDGVVIFNKKVISPQTISTFVDEDVIPFTLENYDNIHAFLKRHYHPDLLRDTEAATHPDKKQRSVSPYSSFSQKGRIKREEPDVADKIVAHLQGSPLWEEIRRSPEVLDEVCRRVKRALSAERSRPAGAAK